MVNQRLRCLPTNVYQRSPTNVRHMKSHHSQNYQNRGNRGQMNRNQNQLNGNDRNIVCRFWMRGNCLRGTQCSFDHPISQNTPVMCRDGDYCQCWPRCKYPHAEVKMCHFQDRCRRQNCQFAHENMNFLEGGNNIQAPNMQSYQDFPPFPPKNMWRPW